MKKALAVALCAALALGALCACGQQAAAPQQNGSEGAEEENTASQALTGGWEKAESPVITEEIRALLDKATAEMVGAEYEPVAYLGSQVVAGTNYCLLFKYVTTDSDPISSYALVTIYKDLEGNADVLDIFDCEAENGSPDLLGGWKPADDPTVTDAARTALEKALKGTDAGALSPVALLATQLVSGTNYALLCEVTSSALSPEGSCMIVHVYEDLSGNAEITESYAFLPSNG